MLPLWDKEDASRRVVIGLSATLSEPSPGVTERASQVGRD
jgi:hypothetical protein